jgi:hypothetical protein
VDKREGEEMIEIIVWTLLASLIPNLILCGWLISVVKDCNEDREQYQRRLAELNKKSEEMRQKSDKEIIDQGIQSKIYDLWLGHWKNKGYYPAISIEIGEDNLINVSVSTEAAHRFIEENFKEELKKYSGLVNDRYHAGYIQGVFDHSSGTIDPASLAVMRNDLMERLRDSTTKRYEQPFQGLLT